jgi:hypothetical protein
MRRCRSFRNPRIALAIILVAGSGCAVPSAFADSPDLWDGDWHGSITPYAWLPGITGETRFELPSGPTITTKSDNDLLSTLSGGFLLEGDIRKGNWGMFADVLWVKFSDEKGHLTSIGGERFGANADLDTRWGVKGGLVDFAGLYTLGHGSQGYIDLLFGARYLWLKGNLSWNFSLNGAGGHEDIQDSEHLNNQTHVSDGIVGVSGRWTPIAGSGWYFPYYVDIGGGDSDNTYQLNVGAGYAFHWGDIALTYRDIKYEEGSSDKFLKKVQLSGPSLNFTWHF